MSIVILQTLLHDLVSMEVTDIMPTLCFPWMPPVPVMTHTAEGGPAQGVEGMTTDLIVRLATVSPQRQKAML